MSDRSANLSLPFILPSQAQKHVTHNEALVALDALVQLSVLSATDTSPPADPDDGARYVVPAGATGAWAGQTGKLAVKDTSGWLFLSPREGWTAWVQDQGTQIRYTGSGWAGAGGGYQNISELGVNTTADATNRLAVASDASLLSHDGAGHQLKLNKATVTDTASLLMQSNWSGRAEIGLVGNDELVFKVSDDGVTFRTALSADPVSGSVDFPHGATGLTPAEMGAPVLTTLDYLTARIGLVGNGAGHLPSARNLPAGATRDLITTPDLPAAFSFAGHYPGVATMEERIAVDPATCYRMRCYLRQEAVAGDWSAYAEDERHQQGVGLVCYDRDGLEIEPRHHKRFRAGSVDSLTTLAAPLSPGDTTITLTDASGWNDSDAAAENCGVILFGYRDSGGRLQPHYSRIVDHGLFAPGGVNTSTHVVTLSAPFPGALGNPVDGGGVWPAGTPIANTAAGSGPKLCLVPKTVPAATGTWYLAEGYIGGIDRSGADVAANFAPGTAFVRPAFQPNLSNRTGGWSGFPDTGSAQRVWFAGVALSDAPLTVREAVSTGAASGSWALHAPVAVPATGALDIAPAAPTLQPV